jgi:FkbM family methyltransferase
MPYSRATGLRWLPNYLRSFGAAGLPLFLRMLRIDRADSREPERVAVPGLGAVWLRPAMRDHAIFQQVWVKREYDLAAVAPHHFAGLMGAYHATLAEGRRPLILDAGAHIGLSVLWWRRLFPAARIVAIEPSAVNLEVLRRNLAGIDDVRVLSAALAAEAGTLNLVGCGDVGSAVRVAATGTGSAVQAVTVQEIMQAEGAAEILLAKIDIEGGEQGLFSGNVAWLDRTRALVIETHDWLYPGAGTSRPLFAAIGARQMDFLTSGENVLLFRSD